MLAFNGPSANVLSGQRGPRAQRHFNGCHDERVKCEHGDPVSSIGKNRVDRAEERREETDGRRGEDRWHYRTGM